MAGERLLVGVDGCPSGWIAVFAVAGENGDFDSPEVALFTDFSTLTDRFERAAAIAVDMPIGLPERIEGSGRGPEQAVRPMLGARQSSVFSIPSRPAVYAPDYPAACGAAVATSAPAKKVSKQAFMIFPKIREIDGVLRRNPAMPVYEVHPEFAFTRLNGDKPMRLPKKVKSRVNPAGIAERRALLAGNGFSEDFLARRPPPGAAVDDFIDACACLAIARRIVSGRARPWPLDYRRDRHALPIAIWG